MNRRNVFMLSTFIVGQFVLTSCVADWFGISGRGSFRTESRSAKGFQTIELRTSADISIVKADSFKVEVTDYENLLSHISITVTAHNLIIGVEPLGTTLLNSKSVIRISMPDSLIKINLLGSGSIHVDSTFKDIQTLIVAGSGDINLKKTVKLKNLSASILGSGNITANGTVNSLTALTSGSGNMYFSNLIANDADCSIAGSGNMYVNATTTLKAKITGSGNIEYKGSAILTSTVLGSGTLSYMN